PNDIRVPLILHFLQDRTQQEVADELGLSRATIARRLQEGVERLRERLGHVGVATSAVALVAMLQSSAVCAAPPALVAELGRLAMAGVGSVQPVAGGGSASAAANAAPAWAASVLTQLGGVWTVAAVLGLVVTAVTAMQLLSQLAVPTRPLPYDRIEQAYARYTPAGDPFGFPAKIASLADTKFKFWRGTKDLYYQWAKVEAGDWLADSGAYVVAHGDLHPGNLGTYATGPNRVAFGLVDFDDSARLPFQLELVHGLVSLELASEARGMPLDDAERRLIADAMFGSYRAALASPRTASEQLRGAPLVDALFAKASRPYAAVFRDLVAASGKQFVAVVQNKKGNVKEVLRPADELRPQVAAALAAAVARSDALRAAFAVTEPAVLAASIRAVAARTRVGSSGSQGLKKYVVLMKSPLRDMAAGGGGDAVVAGGTVGGDVVLYLKQQIPAAAERAGLVAPDPRAPADRCVAHMRQVLGGEQPWVLGAVELNGDSYWLSVREPWGTELEPDDVGSAEDVRAMARVWGTAAGAAHRRGSGQAAVLARLTPEARALIVARAAACAARLAADYASFRADPRVSEQQATLERALRAIRSEPGNVEGGGRASK
ncbi:MAG TPA: DUF2252 family protein, partial [Tepidisphaeraceae bacterium]|nr:DUF2252 family protein [Tepidisphaeraceae bacterium]